jgi:hypothetical protein
MPPNFIRDNTSPVSHLCCASTNAPFTVFPKLGISLFRFWKRSLTWVDTFGPNDGHPDVLKRYTDVFGLTHVADPRRGAFISTPFRTAFGLKGPRPKG